MNTPIYEQETIITFCRDSDQATVYTADTTMMTKLDKLVATSGDWYLTGTHKFKDGTIADKTYECPKRFISFRSKAVEAKPLTEEQKEAKREILRNLRNSATGSTHTSENSG